MRRSIAGSPKIHRTETGNNVLVFRVVFLCRRKSGAKNQ
jgi:hypothetical protein